MSGGGQQQGGGYGADGGAYIGNNYGSGLFGVPSTAPVNGQLTPYGQALYQRNQQQQMPQQSGMYGQPRTFGGYGNSYANSGLARYGAMPSWQVPAYQPRMYQPPQLGPQPSWYAPPGAGGGMSPPAYSSPGTGPGEGPGSGGSAAPSNNQGPTPGLNGQAVGLGLSTALGPIGFAIGQAVNGMGATSGVANDADAAAAAAANGPGMGAVGVGPGVSGGEAASGNSQGEAGDDGSDGGMKTRGGGAGGK